MRIGILGGTFDPIHNGHIHVANFCRLHLQLDCVFLVPAGNPPHKKTIISYEHRSNMVKLAVKDIPGLYCKELEHPDENSGHTYTVLTLKKVRAQHKKSQVFFFIGEDNVPELQTWFQYKKLFSLATIVVLSRAQQRKIMYDDLWYKKKLVFLNMPLVSIASRDIRKKLAKNQSISELVPHPVEQYIRTNCLYSTTAPFPA